MFGQEGQFINGKLMDAKTESPIPFATIKVKNKPKGVISNLDGGFKIPNEFKRMGDTLVVSSIGYISKEIILSNLNGDQINIIRLSERIAMLDEVTVVGSKKVINWSASKIVRQAIDKISENFPFKPFSYVGYYRDYQIKDGKYVNLNEAVLQVFDPGFDVADLTETQTRILFYKKNLDFPVDTIAAKPYDYLDKSKIIPNATIDGLGGNEYIILRLHDAIRNYDVDAYDFVNRLKTDFLINHDLSILPDTYIDNMLLYAIKISKTLENFQVEGKMFISKGDFRIYKMEYGVHINEEPQRDEEGLFAKNPNLVKTINRKLLYRIIVEYQPHDGIMYPNYISLNNSFDVLPPAKFKLTATKWGCGGECIELVFNNTLSAIDAFKKSKYSLRLKDTKLRIEKINVKRNKVLIYPKETDMLFDYLVTQSTLAKHTNDLKLEVKNVSDIYGNVVNKQELLFYNQFREFFVQEIKPNEVRIFDTLNMIKTKPIFEGQPILAPENLSGYWINTPLNINK